MKIILLALSFSILANAEEVIQVAVGVGSTCALVKSGKIKCWGHNEYGQLGIGDRENRSSPDQDTVLPLKAINIQSSGEHFCAILEDKTLWCWGFNEYGQLGLGDIQHRDIPELVKLPKVVKSVSLGATASCATLEDHSVYCWGHNPLRMLGMDDDSGTVNLPKLAKYIGKDISRIILGPIHACGILNNGEVTCWGSNLLGNLGVGTTPLPVPGVPPARPGQLKPRLKKKVLSLGSVGSHHTCALSTDRKVSCWGTNQYGESGVKSNPTEVRKYVPGSELPLRGNVVHVENGGTFSCAIIENKELVCWGRNEFGQLGQNTLEPIGAKEEDFEKLSPIEIEPGLELREVFVGGNHMCAILEFGLLKCWGDNTYGQLGLGDTENRGDGPNEMGKNLDFVEL